jgi:hypothetical protein
MDGGVITGPKIKWRQRRYWDVVYDCDVIRVTGFDERGQGYWLLAKDDSTAADRRERVLLAKSAITRAIKKVMPAGRVPWAILEER